MNIDDIKSIWKQDMNMIENRVRVNEEKIKELELNKATSIFDKFLKISLAGKNMALIYALVSIFLMYKIWDAPFYVVIVGLGAIAMIFSYFQHSPLKKLDIGSLSIIEDESSSFHRFLIRLILVATLVFVIPKTSAMTS